MLGLVSWLNLINSMRKFPNSFNKYNNTLVALCDSLFEIKHFEKVIRYNQNVKHFGSRSGPTLSGSKLFAKVIRRQHYRLKRYKKTTSLELRRFIWRPDSNVDKSAPWLNLRFSLALTIFEP